jgi:hypothetical protein
MLAHKVLDPKNTPPMFKYRHLPLYYVVNIILRILPFSLPYPLCDLGMIIPIGRGGLCETSMRLYPPCNPIGIGPLKNLCFKLIYRFIYIYYVIVDILL